MHSRKFTSTLTVLALVGCCTVLRAEPQLKKGKLQIVFLFGQSNMVGSGHIRTAWYLTQPQYVPPYELVAAKTRYFDWSSLFWQGLRYYKGPDKDKVAAISYERRASRGKWRRIIRGTWPKEKQPKGRGEMYAILDQKAEEEGIYRRLADFLESDTNEFKTKEAYAEIAGRDTYNAEILERVRKIYLNGTTAEDFDAFEAEFRKVDLKDKSKTPEEIRASLAALAEKHLNLPVAKRTRIFGHGAIAGSEGEGVEQTTYGPLSVGYAGGQGSIGPEYGVGITLERLVDAPILLVKCSWGNTSLADAWRAPSLDGVETATEKANREAWNKSEAERAKKEGRELKPRPAPEKKGKLAWCWHMVMPQVDRVLADPGKYHPEYDPKVGYEVAGLVWFQGYCDMNNTAYGELLAQMITDFRKKVKTPKMPVVCGTLGGPTYNHVAYSGAVNEGMVQVSRMPEFAGTVDVVNTGRFNPIELGLTQSMIRNVTLKRRAGNEDYGAKYDLDKANTVLRRAISNKGFHYYGSAKFFILTGDAMARSLANLMAGNEPFVNAELKSLNRAP